MSETDEDGDPQCLCASACDPDPDFCGTDGCGATCNPCAPGFECNPYSEFCTFIEPECEPDCDSAECGDDGCGGSCGECDDGSSCADNVCLPDDPETGGPCTTNDDCAPAEIISAERVLNMPTQCLVTVKKEECTPPTTMGEYSCQERTVSGSCTCGEECDDCDPECVAGY